MASKKRSATPPPVDPTEFVGMYDGDPGVAVMDPPEDAPVDMTELDRLLSFVGERAILPDSTWDSLLDLSGRSLYQAELCGWITRTTRTSADPRREPTVTGYSASGVREMIAKHSVKYELTPSAHVMMRARPDDVIRVDHVYIASDVSKLFGLRESDVHDACRLGELCEGNSKCSPSWIPGSALLEWVQRNNIKLTISPGVAGRVARQWRATDEAVAEAAAKADETPTLVDETFTRIEDALRDEAAEAAEERAAMLVAYTEILRRHDSPKERDAQTLVELCRELRFSREDVDRDIAVLDEARALEALALTARDARKEVEAAGRHKKELAERFETELKEAHRRCRRAWESNSAAERAPGELVLLKKNHSHLFGASQ